jgi:F-type H+-transporting ATPase subunit alpha
LLLFIWEQKDCCLNVPVNKVREFEAEFLQVMQSKHSDTLKSLAAGKFDDEITGY